MKISITSKENRVELLNKVIAQLEHFHLKNNSKQFIRDVIVKDLIRTYVELQSEDFIY